MSTDAGLRGDPLPGRIEDLRQLEEMLSEPTEGVIETMGRLEGDLVVLGAAGKMGPTLARMARRASDVAGVSRRVIGVSRFSDQGAEEGLRQCGVETIRCDLLDEEAVARLPEAPNVVYMAGMKFGATGNEALTWAMNVYVPAAVCKRYRNSRIVAFSTGNVYGLTPLAGGGSLETSVPAPEGDYAMSCLGRERIFTYFSQALDIPVALIRLNYACEMRYGVLVDMALKIWTGQPVDVTMGAMNVLWQADASAMPLQALEHAASPPCVLNLTGPERVSVRDVCTEMGRLMAKEVRFEGAEAPNALLSNSVKAYQLFGAPRVGLEQLVEWTADWIQRGGETLNKPTHFEVRDGKY